MDNLDNRYSRHYMLDEIGQSGQKKLSEAKVLIVGVGGLGSPIAIYLAGAGLGTIGIIDADVVNVTNLHRQVLYSSNQIGLPKVSCASERLKDLNPNVNVICYPYFLDEDNALEIISNYDIIVDGCDNFATRYIIDNICSKLHKPYVFGAITSFQGQVCVFNYNSKISYSQLFPNIGEQDNQAVKRGVVGPTAAIIGSMQAAEVLKIICGFGDVLDGILFTYNVLNNESNSYKLATFF